MGTGPGSDRPRCRRSTPDLPSRYPLQLRSEGPERAHSSPEGAAHPPGPGPRWKPPGRAQRAQGAPCAAAGALDHGHRAGSDRPRCRRSTPDLPQPVPLQPRSEGPGRSRSSPEGAADPPGLAHVGSCQDVRSTARTPGAQLPEPSIMGTVPDQTGHAAADPRQGTRSRYPLQPRSEGSGGPAAARRVLPILPGPGPRWKPPGRALPPCLQNESIG
jgi:hypothetical protein